MGSCRSLSVYLTTPYCSKRLTCIVHILSPETDNCPFESERDSERDRRTIENIFHHSPRKNVDDPLRWELVIKGVKSCWVNQRPVLAL